MSQKKHEHIVDPEEPDRHPDTEDAPYAEDTPLTWIFGNHPEVKLIAAFLSERGRQINKSEMARLAGISRNDVYEHLESLQTHNIITPTQNVGQTDITLYKLTDSQITQILSDLEAELLKHTYQSDVEPTDTSTTSEHNQRKATTTNVEEPYAEGTPLTWLFGDHPEAKLIAAVLSERDTQLNVSDWARIAGVSRSAVYNHRDKLLTHNVVERGDATGRSQYYHLNTETPVVSLLIDLENALLKNWSQSNSTDI